MELNPPDPLPPPVEVPFHGARPATILGGALILALALLVAVRWVGKPAASAEQIVQVPVAVAAPTPTPRPEVFAPDPGDNP